MNKKKIERTIVAFLFVLVLVVFSFAERDSKKLEKIYNTAQLIKKGATVLSDVATEFSASANSNN